MTDFAFQDSGILKRFVVLRMAMVSPADETRCSLFGSFDHANLKAYRTFVFTSFELTTFIYSVVLQQQDMISEDAIPPPFRLSNL